MSHLVPIGDSGGVALEDVQGTLARARMLIGSRSVAGARRDGRVSVVTRGSAIDELRRRNDRAMIRQMRRRGWRIDASVAAAMRADGARLDAPVGTGAPGYPRDFEYRRMRILQELRRPLNSEILFPMDPEPPPPGALTHTVRRRVATGEATIWRGPANTGIPMVDVDDEEEEADIAHIICGVGADFFTELSNNYANMDKYTDKARHAIRVILEMMNRFMWAGFEDLRLAGVLNHPDLAKRILAATFDGEDDPADVVAELNLLVNTPYIVSGQVFKPNRLVVSPAIGAYLRETQFADSTGISIADWFLNRRANDGITQIEEAHELSAGSPEMVAAGAPSNRDGLLAYSDAPDACRRVVVQSPTFLPIYRSDPFSTIEVAYASVGGVAMWDIGNAALGFATPRSY